MLGFVLTRFADWRILPPALKRTILLEGGKFQDLHGNHVGGPALGGTNFRRGPQGDRPPARKLAARPVSHPQESHPSAEFDGWTNSSTPEMDGVLCPPGTRSVRGFFMRKRNWPKNRATKAQNRVSFRFPLLRKYHGKIRAS